MTAEILDRSAVRPSVALTDEPAKSRATSSLAPIGPGAYVYASEIALGRPDGSIYWAPNYVVFCPEHVHTIAMPRELAVAKKVAASHNALHAHSPAPSRRRMQSGRLDYFDVLTQQVRRVT